MAGKVSQPPFLFFLPTSYGLQHQLAPKMSNSKVIGFSVPHQVGRTQSAPPQPGGQMSSPERRSPTSRSLLTSLFASMKEQRRHEGDYCRSPWGEDSEDEACTRLEEHEEECPQEDQSSRAVPGAVPIPQARCEICRSQRRALSEPRVHACESPQNTPVLSQSSPMSSFALFLHCARAGLTARPDSMPSSSKLSTSGKLSSSLCWQRSTQRTWPR